MRPGDIFCGVSRPVCTENVFGGSKNAASVLESPKIAESENL